MLQVANHIMELPVGLTVAPEKGRSLKIETLWEGNNGLVSVKILLKFNALHTSVDLVRLNTNICTFKQVFKTWSFFLLHKASADVVLSVKQCCHMQFSTRLTNQ